MERRSTSRPKETRSAKRSRIDAEILDVARTHLATDGAAALSLRAIARELGMVSSAIYRYVESRDELLTRLVTEAYDDLADDVATAVVQVPSDSHRDRLRAIASAFRAWAVREPPRYALLYGSPVPGYHAPPERTVGPGTRVIALVVAQVEMAGQTGILTDGDPQPDGLDGAFDELRSTYGLHISDAQLVRTFVWWAGLIGVVGQEVFDGYGDSFNGIADALFDNQLEVLIDQLIGGEGKVPPNTRPSE